MGTSSSGSGPKGQSHLLPNWALDVPDSLSKPDEQDVNPVADIDNDSDSNAIDASENDSAYANSLTSAKGGLRRWINGRSGATVRKAARQYVKGVGGYKKATRASKSGIIAGGNYLAFLGDVAKKGRDQALIDNDLADCLGKSTNEVFARIANKISPIGTTNDEAISRAAVMISLDRLYNRHLPNDDQSEDPLENLTEETLKETVIEFVSAYIFKKWVYEAGLALENNNLSEVEVIELEDEMKSFIKHEVISGIGKINIRTLKVDSGEGAKIIQKIFELAYSTLEQ